ncbi:hypothetical protein EY643_05590 [Halioglobus maricola]|uniref:DUF3261 domain-containing protein n=1 Tax=Halioglobus maricola TaxID=2601894 RepID=A0A5P9NIW6_9GAMM|nr:DUF6702 family protein [Halioglobus maricola]QFU75164.1 hypothetical protein EY643_05590 [Halioglobus maricola]
MTHCFQSFLRCLTLVLFAAQTQAHPSHTSFAEIGWAESGEQLEVALRVIPEDLEEVLALQQGRAVTLMDSPAVQSMVHTWLSEEFRVYAGDSLLPIALVGMELESYRASWLFFTVNASPDEKLTLQNRILIRHNSAARARVQINTVQRLWQPANDRMTFTDEHPQSLWVPQQ